MKEIKEFRGKYYFLSNFYRVSVTYEGLTYPSSEAAFQAAKCLNDEDKLVFTHLRPSLAKAIGKQINIRPDWDNVRLKCMFNICLNKFTQNQDLLYQLLDTKDYVLIEGNTWGDTFWGVCEGGGTNHLGRILMFIRTVLLFCEGQLSEGYLHEFLCDSNYHIYANIEETFDIIVLNTKKQIYESNIDKYKKNCI